MSPSLPIFTGTPGDLSTAAAAAFVHGLAPTADLLPTAATDVTTDVTTDTASSAPQLEVSSLPGFAAVPHHLIKRIVVKEYIDMAEMLPDSWKVETSKATSGYCSVTKHPCQGMVTDVLVWTECYATMASILATTFPDKAPLFTATSRRSSGRRETLRVWHGPLMMLSAAAKGPTGAHSSGGLLITPSTVRLLPAGCTSSRATSTTWQTLMRHTSVCAPATPQAIPLTALDGRRPPSRAIYHTNPASRLIPVPKICRLYNSTGCRHFRCKYAHVCACCRMPHPAPRL